MAKSKGKQLSLSSFLGLSMPQRQTAAKTNRLKNRIYLSSDDDSDDEKVKSTTLVKEYVYENTSQAPLSALKDDKSKQAPKRQQHNFSLAEKPKVVNNNKIIDLECIEVSSAGEESFRKPTPQHIKLDDSFDVMVNKYTRATKDKPKIDKNPTKEMTFDLKEEKLMQIKDTHTTKTKNIHHLSPIKTITLNTAYEAEDEKKKMETSNVNELTPP